MVPFYQNPSQWLSPEESAFTMSLLLSSLQFPLSPCFCSPYGFIHTFMHAPIHLFNNSLSASHDWVLSASPSDTPPPLVFCLQPEMPSSANLPILEISVQCNLFGHFSYSFTHVLFLTSSSHLSILLFPLSQQGRISISVSNCVTVGKLYTQLKPQFLL